MAYTKRDIINLAYEQIGYATYTYDLQPEQYISTLRRLDTLVAMWNSRGINIAYPLPSEPSGADIDTPLDIPDYGVLPLYLNLAVSLAPTIGKVLSTETRILAKQSLMDLYRINSKAPKRKFDDTLITGAGNKTYGSGEYNTFIQPLDDNLTTGNGDELEF